MSALWPGAYHSIRFSVPASLVHRILPSDLVPSLRKPIVGLQLVAQIHQLPTRPQLDTRHVRSIGFAKRSHYFVDRAFIWDRATQARSTTTIQRQRASSLVGKTPKWLPPVYKEVKKPQNEKPRKAGVSDKRESEPQYVKKTFSQAEINSAFGLGMDFAKGNRVLNLVQQQRVSGTIDEGVPGSRRAGKIALAWLRRKYPVDEDAAILARFDKEEIRTYVPQEKPEEVGLYGPSNFDRIKAENEAKRAQWEKEEQERERQRAEELARNPPRSRSRAIDRPRAMAPAWVQEYRKKAEKNIEKVPEMTMLQRLGPATVALAIFTALAVLFAQNYTPPSQAARIWPSLSPAQATISACVGINVLIFLAWRLPPLWITMNTHFLIVPALPRVSSLLGSIFSHQNFVHLLGNVVALSIVGTYFHEDVGRGPFLAIYLAGGFFASYCFLANAVFRKTLLISSLGSSGVICNLLAAWCCVDMDRGFRIWPLPDSITEGFQPLFLLAVLVGIDLFGLLNALKLGLGSRAAKPLVDHVSHLAGYAAGAIAGFSIRYRVKQQQAALDEAKKKSAGTGTITVGLNSSGS
ncbi:MAG: hypothetical protein Q9167_002064 [Letrouitia subvulpina]